MAKKGTKAALIMDDNELIAPLPVLALPPAKQEKVNFLAQKEFLAARLNHVLSLKLTEDNLERVRVLKKGIVAWRTQFTKETDDYIKVTFNAPRDIFKAARDEVLAEIGVMEGKANEVLDKQEQERITGVNEVIDHYIEKFQAQYSLDGEHLARVERRKSYYNKTADEKARKDDIEQQFKDLRKEQDAHAANVRLIAATCKEEPRLRR